MAIDESDGLLERFEELGVPPPDHRCPICGSDVHGPEAHLPNVVRHGEEMGAVAPRGAGLCDKCGSDVHTTAEHPGT